MKIDNRSIDRFLDSPDPAVSAVLLYGPDQGLVLERANHLGRNVVSDLSDPFATVELSAAALKDDPARLSDEARAMSFGGGNRLVRIRGAGDSLSSTLGDYLSDPAPQSLLIIDGNELSARSSLRKLFEGHDRAAAIACYPAEGRDLAKSAEAILREYGVSADNNVLAALSVSLGSDRGMVRKELEKLALYVGEGGQVTLEDITSCLTDSTSVSLDRLVYSVGDGKMAAADSFYHKALEEGVSEIAILRMLQRHFQRLEWVVSQTDMGKPRGSAISGLRPPVFFKFKDQFERQSGRWPARKLQHALAMLSEAEIACKSTGIPAQLVCGRTVLAIARSVA